MEWEERTSVEALAGHGRTTCGDLEAAWVEDGDFT